MKCKLFSASLALALAATTGAAQAQKAEVVHWWTSSSESAAVREIANAFQKAGGVWVDQAVAGGSAARAVTINRIAGGSPPAAAQFNTSKQYRELIAEGMLSNVDAVALKEGWEQLLPRPVLDSIRVDGHYYATPVNIHNPGWFWYSKAALQKAGVTAEPRDIDEFFAALDKLKAAGLIPIAVGSQGWQESLTFNALLVNIAGKDSYLKFYQAHDPSVVDSAPFKRTLQAMRKLRGYVDAGSPGRNWNDGTALLINGKAGYQIMGDWAKGEFANARQLPGKDYGCFSGFTPTTPYVIGGDVFVFPKTGNAQMAKTQQLLASVIVKPATQIAFNNKKGSIPVRMDTDPAQFDICAQAGIAALKDRTRHLPVSDMLMTPDMLGSVTDVISQFWNSNMSIEAASRALRNALKS
ncbi:ABC transporter substrate-binding protein [Comamonas composti]|uniref:ABC transporter substrate-binding protein n=1 Tax=Comamonas composti TaxID=408558 RepID=UPI0004123E7C|nr:ABC transporter substrate-binding protein [Comamonas composti]